MAYNLNGTQIDYVQYEFLNFLRQGGSRLQNACMPFAFEGDYGTVRKSGVGAATISELGSNEASKNVSEFNYEARVIAGKVVSNRVQINYDTLFSQGNLDLSKSASDLAETCGNKLDTLIVEALGGNSLTKTTRGLPDDSSVMTYNAFDAANTVAMALGNGGTSIADNALNVRKVMSAATKLKSYYNTGPIVCIANANGMAQLRQDGRMASSDFNVVKSLANPSLAGQIPFGGIDYFIECEVDTGYDAINPTYKYAYVYALDKLYLGTQSGRSFKIDSLPNLDYDGAPRIICSGVYGATRIDENSVVRIEYNDAV